MEAVNCCHIHGVISQKIVLPAMRTPYRTGSYALQESMSVMKITVFWDVMPYTLAN
jgi:hypothetical protein